MPKKEETIETIATRTRSQTPAPPKPVSAIGKHVTGGPANPSKIKISDTEKVALKKVKDGRAFNAEPSLSLDGTGICHINTGKMADRSTHEVYNYAYLINRYIEKQRGKKVKIKSTKKKREAQALFCGAVRKDNSDLFDKLNEGKTAKQGMFSVVGHLPDQCLFVSKNGESFNQSTYSSARGIGQAPGWMPMTGQANGLVAKIGNQTEHSSGQQNGPYLSKILVDGMDPTCLIPIPAITEALGYEPFPDQVSGGGGDSGENLTGPEGKKEVK